MWIVYAFHDIFKFLLIKGIEVFASVTVTEFIKLPLLTNPFPINDATHFTQYLTALSGTGV